MPFSSTRIEPSLASVATAIFSPVGLGEGLADAAGELDPPHAANSATAPRANATTFVCTKLDTEVGYAAVSGWQSPTETPPTTNRRKH